MCRALPTSMKSSTATNSSFSKATAWDTSTVDCLTINEFAVQAEMVAVETFNRCGQYPIDLLQLPLLHKVIFLKYGLL